MHQKAQQTTQSGERRSWVSREWVRKINDLLQTYEGIKLNEWSVQKSLNRWKKNWNKVVICGAFWVAESAVQLRWLFMVFEPRPHHHLRVECKFKSS